VSFSITKQFSVTRRRQRPASIRESLNAAAQILLVSVALAHGFDREAVKLICALAAQEQIHSPN
jgi:hypothetical protein